MAIGSATLYNLLPAIYRERDSILNYPLRALLGLIESQAVLLESDIQQFYRNLFIETCDSWVIPYIGDLVGNNLLFDAGRIEAAATAQALFRDLAGRDLRPPVAARSRADVAKTIYYRRRKATPRMLEELARDVTGWPAHVVEFFQHLGWTQNVEHLRPGCQWADIRSLDRMDRIDGAFDETVHTVDVRQIAQQEGWYNIRNIGFFLWRVRSYPLVHVPARHASQPWRYHFSPLGNPAPLFTRLRPAPADNALVREIDVPAPIRPVFFFQDLDTYRTTPPVRPDFTALYGSFEPLPATPTVSSVASFFIVLNGTPVEPSQNPAAPVSAFLPQITCGILDPWPAVQPAGKIIVVDVARGRFAIGDGWPDNGPVDVWYHYGFSADLGGGPYDRRKWLLRRNLDPAPRVYEVRTGGAAPLFPDVLSALAQWQTDLRPNAIVSILDSRTYDLPNSIVLRNEGSIAIEAADRERPLLLTPAGGTEVDVLAPIAPGDPDRNGVLTLSGVVVEGFFNIIGDLGRVRLLHATLIPGRALQEDGTPATAKPGIVVAPASATGAAINAQLEIQAAYAILGGLEVPSTSAAIRILDSIVDGGGGSAVAGPTGTPGPPLQTERSTFFGGVLVKSLEASETIFASKVDAERTQQGCVRFSYVPPGSHTPRRFRCQPDLEADQKIAAALKANPGLTAAERAAIQHFVEGWLRPSFRAVNYGSPFYAQLHLGCPAQIRTGAEDESEMGAFSHLKQPQRESNLKIRAREYLPFNLEAGIIYLT